MLESLAYRVTLNVCGSLILRIGDFLCFAGTNFCDWEKLMGINFCDFQEVAFYLNEQHAVNQWSTFRRSFSLKILTVKYMYL